MKRRYWMTLALLLAVCACSCAQAFDFFEPVVPARAFQVMAHRGMLRQAPENTRPALEQAIEDGIEWAEVDVRLTRDGCHILLHNASVDGVTNGTGKVRDMTVDAIAKLDAGSWFAPRYAGERILTLAQCLALAKGRINLYLDCKDVDPALLAKEILDAGMERQVVVFDDLDKLRVVREKSRGQVPIMPKWHSDDGLDEWTAKWRPDAVEIDADEITADVCRFFHEKGVKVQAKVLDDDDKPEVWDRVLAAGTDWLQTDRAEDILAHRFWKSRAARPVQLACHRGANRYAPKNTRAAYEKAVTLGADYVEIDIRTSQDGQYFILHDGNLDRTTNGKGPIAAATSAAIAGLDAGGWFGRPYQNTPVPRLDETLAFLKGKTHLYIDAKEIAVEVLAEKMKGMDLTAQSVVYQSPEYLCKLKALLPDARGLCPLGNPAQVDELAAKVKPYGFDASWEILSKELIAQCHALNIKVFSDGIGEHESVQDYRQAIEWGIDLIQTDHPLRVIRALELAGVN